MPSDGHFVFFNNLRSPDRSALHSGHNLTSGQEQIQVAPANVPADVAGVVFLMSIHDADQRGQSFGQVQNAFIRVADKADNTKLVR